MESADLDWSPASLLSWVPWAGCLGARSLGFLVHEMVTVVLPSQMWGGCNGIRHVKHGEAPQFPASHSPGHNALVYNACPTLELIYTLQMGKPRPMQPLEHCLSPSTRWPLPFLSSLSPSMSPPNPKLGPSSSSKLGRTATEGPKAWGLPGLQPLAPGLPGSPTAQPVSCPRRSQSTLLES